MNNFEEEFEIKSKKPTNDQKMNIIDVYRLAIESLSSLLKLPDFGDKIDEFAQSAAHNGHLDSVQGKQFIKNLILQGR